MPKPVVQAMVLADHVYQDRQTGKHIIAGTFTTLFFGSPQAQAADDKGQAPPRPPAGAPITRAGSPYLYLALVDVHGQLPLQLRYIDLADAKALFEAQVVVAANDPVAVAEYVLPLPPLPADKAGNYSLDLLYQDELLGSWRITVKKLEDTTGTPPSTSNTD